MIGTNLKSGQISPEEFFNWFTKEVVNSDEVYAKDPLATALVIVKSWGLKSRENIDVEYEVQVKGMGRRRIDVVISDKKGNPLLAIEHENSPYTKKGAWGKIKNSLDKLARFKSEIKIGIFYVEQSETKKEAKKKAMELKGKIKHVIDRQKSLGKWLLIIGMATSPKSWYLGFVIEKGQLLELGEKELPETITLSCC